MTHHLQYGAPARPISKAAILSLCAGLLVCTQFILIARYGLPPELSIEQRWLIVGPGYLVAIAGVTLAVVAMVGQRRLWWLSILGLLVSGLPLLVAALLFVSRLG